MLTLSAKFLVVFEIYSNKLSPTTVDPSRKKHVHARHQASATKAIGQADDLLAPGKPDRDKLSLALCEKLETLNAEIFDIV